MASSSRCDASFNTFGWELTLKSVEESVKKEDDVLLLFIHWLLVRNGYQCIGLGEHVELSDNEVKSEILPTGWSNGDTYALRYLDSNGKLYVIRGIRNDVHIIFNLIRAEDLNVTSSSFDSKKEVKCLKGNLESMLPNYKTIAEKVEKNMLDAQKDDKKRDASTTQDQSREIPSQPQPRRDPLMIGEPMRPRVDPFDYGRSDLDPLSSMRPPGGGGMLFDPFADRRHPSFDPSSGLPGPRLPRGAVPPGARFDPFGPPDFGNGFGIPNPRGPRLPGSGPNPDMLPPGYDDMFM